VDGNINAENKFSDIVISAKDSMYIFVEITVDPNNEDSPVLVADSIVFQTNGVKQRVRLDEFAYNGQ
jgi:hypothetical protein